MGNPGRPTGPERGLGLARDIGRENQATKWGQAGTFV